MSPKSKRSAKVSPNKDRMNKFEAMMVKTLKEMIIDLEQIDSQKSKQLIDTIAKLDDKDVMRDLQNPDSELVKNIPRTVLEEDASGAKYLNILCLVQPSLKPRDPIVTTAKNIDANAKDPSSSQVPSTSSVQLNQMVPDFIDADLLNLAESVAKDLDEDSFKQAFQDKDINSMMSICTQASTIIQNKVEDGGIDLKKLQDQTMKVVDKMKDTEAFQMVIKDNPALSMMWNNIL
jgi:hypothetical protein